MIKTLGKSAKFGSIDAFQHFLELFLIPIFTPLGYVFKLLSTIAIGTFIVALSPFILYFWHAVVEAKTEFSFILFIIINGIGKSIVGPRISEIAFLYIDKGKEGTFAALG